ncbi:hypothetical protein Tco_0531758 [Tanacetum coccineum]
MGAAVVASPTRVLKLDTHSSSGADPSESSPPLVFVAHMVLPFLGLDDSESDTEIPKRHVSPTSFTLEIPAPILPAPSTIVAPSSEVLTKRKSVIPLSSHRLALRYTSHHLAHFTSGSSSSHSSSDHSSGHSILGHSLSRHTPPGTTDADLSTLLRFAHPSLARTPRCSEAYLRWRSSPLSTMYLLTTSELSAGDSSSKLSVRSSHKRCRSPAATVTSSIHATRALVPSRADLLLPCKRFRDSISPEDRVEKDINTDVLEDIEADVMAVEVTVDRDFEARVDACIDMEVDVGVDVKDEVEDEVKSSNRGTIEVGVDVVAEIDIPDAMLMPDAIKHLEQFKEGLQDIYDHVIEIPLQRIENIRMGQRELESRSVIAGGERASLLEQVASLERSNVRLRGTMMMERARTDRMRFRRLETFANMKAIEELINRRVEEALAAYEATRPANALEAENQSQNGSDGDNGNGGNRNDFMKCQPLNFKGMKGVVRLISALTWWNSHKRIIGAEAAFSMSRRELMKLMAERFQELTMMCTKMVPEEEDRVEKLIGGLPDNIQGNVIVAEPIRLQDAIRIANNLMDKKLKGYAVKNSKNKRRLEVNQRDNRRQQGHYRSDCPKLKNKNHGNKTGNKNGVGEARGKAYVLGGGDANPDSNVIKGMYLLNNHYASMIFDSDTDRSFVSTTFNTLLDVTPDTLDVSYAVELVDGKNF